MASSSDSGFSMPGESGPSGSGDGAFSQFMTEVKEIEKRDSVLTPQQQIDRLLRPGSTYFNLNPFEVLQVDPDTPMEQIKKLYRKLSILVHPDKNPDNRDRAQQAFEILSKAMKTLNDDKERQAALEMIKEAKEKTDYELNEARKQLKREGKSTELEEDRDPQKDQSASSSASTSNEQQTQKQKKTPAQETLRANIKELEKKVDRLLQQSRESDDLQGHKDLKAGEDELKRAKQKLSWLEGNAAYQKKYRDQRKRDLAEIKEKHPLVAYELRPGKRTKNKEAEKTEEVKDEEEGVHTININMKKPVQEESATKIMRLEEELTALRQASLVKKVKTYVLGDGKVMTREDLKELIGAKKLDLCNEKMKLTTLQANAVRQKKYRDRKKKQLEQLQKSHPQLACKLKTRNKRGRPRIEETQPDLLKVLEEVAGAAAAGDNKNGDTPKPALTGKSLRDLTIEMKQRGFKLSRSAAYLRLAPRATESPEGKRHVKYVPVKLRPQTGHGKQHIDGKFAAASIQYVQELTSVLGPQVVGYVIQDNGCRVRFKSSGENSSEHMVLDYRAPQSDSEAMRLKSLDGTKLVLSLYGACQIHKNGMGEQDKVTKVGPTYIAVRSGRYLASAAYAHWDDFNIVVQRPEFKDFLRRPDGSVKPVMVLFVSGSHDENPHSAKALQVAACHFKVHNLDAMFIVSDAPGKGSYYHPAEKRVQVLTECLSKLAIPRNHFTSHLDEHGHCIDDTLEKENFKAAGETLSEVWSEASFESHPIIAKYVEPSDEPEGRRWEGVNHDERWKAEHVRQSQYCLQIVRCDNDVCCGPWRSNLKGILSERFVPPPIPFMQGDNGPEAPEPNQLGSAQYGSLAMRIAMSSVLPCAVQKFRIIPYDFYCPSLQVQLSQRICRWCGLYHVSQKALRPHTRIHSSTETSQPSTTADPVQIEKLTELVEAAVATEVVVSEPTIQVQVQPQIQTLPSPAPQVQVQVQTTPHLVWSTTGAQWTTATTTTEQRPPQV
ncbi:uncharacterized protein [Amphiura filiformis]|uniref:uncharacterized protein n=1 Tax=Amphiura filiformis TaxID=82378 RepID=UPI003B20C8EE